MPLYRVNTLLDLDMVVEADNEDDAWGIARQDWKEAASDSRKDVQIYVVGEITLTDKLPPGWDKDCIPYGGDGNQRIKDLLPVPEQSPPGAA
ncbi:hypothetical protein [Achromobacter marplatensis]|jgi:hypothetical protein|uniref:hypothetical protein n=1 Tax=Achromobacter marplatensis TaxID=470868 RepID=UPI0028E5F67D|nr:hypothetical protein [Achromobacter marplatensis]